MDDDNLAAWGFQEELAYRQMEIEEFPPIEPDLDAEFDDGDWPF